MLHWPPSTNTASTTADRYTLTYSGSLQHSTERVDSKQRGTSRRSFVTSEGERGKTHRPTRLTQRGRNAVRGTAQLPYFTGTQESKYRVVLNRTTQTGQDRILRESGRGRHPLKARLATSLSGVRAGGDSLTHPRRSSHSPQPPSYSP